jgi:thioredoxin 1
MSKAYRVIVVLALAGAVAGVLAMRNRKAKPGDTPLPSQAQPAGVVATGAGTAQVRPLPRLVDLGAGQCAACKMMAPILVELLRDYGDRLIVEFIDIREDEGATEAYGIRLIPTQIFYDRDGKELFRHEGFISKQDILTKWKELGVDLTAEPAE